MFTYQVFDDATFSEYEAGALVGSGDAHDIARLAEEGVLDPALRAAWEAAGFRVGEPALLPVAEAEPTPRRETATTLPEMVRELAESLERSFAGVAPVVKRSSATRAELANGAAWLHVTSTPAESLVMLMVGGPVDPSSLNLVVQASMVALAQGTGSPWKGDEPEREPA